jgi:nitrate reductase NapAB chaperone NapD
MTPRNIERLANALEEMPRTEIDLEAAKTLRELGKVFEAARNMMLANTHEQSKAAYDEMRELIRGNRGDNHALRQ